MKHFKLCRTRPIRDLKVTEHLEGGFARKKSGRKRARAPDDVVWVTVKAANGRRCIGGLPLIFIPMKLAKERRELDCRVSACQIPALDRLSVFSCRSILSHWKNLITSRLLRAESPADVGTVKEIQRSVMVRTRGLAVWCWVRRYWG